MFSPTAEQQFAIDHALQRASFKVVAYAGTGKTTTLKLMSDAMPQRRGTYLAFNKTIAQEAQHKFHAHVQCRTFHSLAYRNVPRGLTDKLRLPRVGPSFLAKDYQLRPLETRRLMGGRYEKYQLMPAHLARLVSDAVSYFCSTHAQYISARHIQAPEWMHVDDINHLQHYLLPFVERRWQESIDFQHGAGIGHDIYLKYWALSNPIIPSDYILFDEAQDADPVMLGILLKQDTQVIYVGDAHQQIYEWRGAVNAMQRLPLPETRLTTSFRFGAEIAHTANSILAALHETVPLHGNPNVRSHVNNIPKVPQSFSQASAEKHTKAILCRTNARAMELLLKGLVHQDKVSLQADHQRIHRFVDAARLLKMGQRVIDVPELAWFNSWHDVHEYCETNEGSDIKPLVKLVDEHGTDQLKKALTHISPIDQADYIISTAHKAKGLEWDHVHLEEDYQFKLNQNDYKISAEELRLLYVACTRAKLSLNIHHIYDLVQQLHKQTPLSMRGVLK